MQLLEKNKQNIDVSREGPALRRLVTNFLTKCLRSRRRSLPCIFQVVAFLPTEVLLLLLLPTLAQIIQDYFGNEPEVNRILEYFNNVI